jgi:hypothetical protein
MLNDPFADGDSHTDTVFRDVILLALAGFMAIVLLLLPHINPPGKVEDTADDPPGNVIVELFWDNERDVDVDLWVRAPGDVPVGYSNRGGIFFNLLRDDLGNYKDTTPINYEVAYSRGIASGEHITNVHLYRYDGSTFGPINVKLLITVVDPDTKVRNQILERDLVMETEGEEITVFRFRLNESGALDPDSVNNLPVALRTGSKSQ